MTEIPETLLIVQRGRGEDHHLGKKEGKRDSNGWRDAKSRFRVPGPPESAEAGRRPAGPRSPTRAREGLNHAAAAGNTWLGSDPDGIPSGRTGATMELQINWEMHVQL